ncbi:hypothetical protein KXW58_006116 [Aspergillus fumigatus]|nr:hypothetical protein KXW58_006116 [Aspergillus fumigatus]
MSKTIASNPWLEYFKAVAFDEPQGRNESYSEANKNISGDPSESAPSEEAAIVMAAEKPSIDLESSALDDIMVLLERAVIVVGVLCSFQKPLVAMSEASPVLDSALPTVKVGVVELEYLAELLSAVVPVTL